ncbi:Peroxisomal nicotinamide adenine dinucleotide carrier [Platanthera guangdongensis]|uniref:Peroxisomal nicotinamide adenine dinucleotide carrier n=1 Tax=Platanthera guangdongensis TaxID=2320717 RepID=A0ABR2M2A2_9ASPA
MSDAIINGVAGAGGGIIAQLITYPLQTVVYSEVARGVAGGRDDMSGDTTEP